MDEGTGADGDTDLTLQPGVETLTITGARPGAHLEVLTAAGQPVVTVVADPAGNAHVSFVPATPTVVATLDDLVAAVGNGDVLAPGDYVVRDHTASPPRAHGPVRVLAVDDHPDPATYEQDLAEGFGYLRTRDGTLLSAMVRFPDEGLYGSAPWPTVVEYSGYGPSNPAMMSPGSLLANLLGFATVGVNMRGTGCSGGVFDVFSPAQAADGYDVIETVARQSWVRHGRPGMVGLSYPGISQLFVAATAPPSLAAITPLSVIDDLWRQQWPGGTYNSGFTRAWLAQRDAETKVGGMAWDQARIDAGDEVAAANQSIRSLTLDFERFGRAARDFRPALGARRAADLVPRIEVPVFLSGSWQDEQTGSRFALMLERFQASPHVVFTLFNGHHPDGFSPMMATRWFEFLSFHVARQVPVVPDLVRAVAPAAFAEHFGYTAELEADRFAHLVDDYPTALARYRAEPPVRVLFESGTVADVPGAPGHRYEVQLATFPPPDAVARRWWLAPGATLADIAPDVEGADRYLDDLEAGASCYALTERFDDFLQPSVPIEWTRFADECTASYETAPLGEALTVMGQGHVDLWLCPGTADTSVQATLTEVRPDGHELRVQSGWHRPVHREEDPERSDHLRVDYTFAPEHRDDLVPGEWVRFRIPFMPVAHVFRAGSRVRLSLSTPGRDQPFWCFDNPVEAGASHLVGRGGAHASALVLPAWSGVDHPEDLPPANAVRGQPARTALSLRNVDAWTN
ncbi:MAG: CocE/NonD family hydrolase [Acidimicrobiales bacterium]|nr:CocE/NonD family hydrolase [Acidimicrobiales bacterium]